MKTIMSEITLKFKVLLLRQLMNENQLLISNGKTLRFGMAREIAAHMGRSEVRITTLIFRLRSRWAYKVLAQITSWLRYRKMALLLTGLKSV